MVGPITDVSATLIMEKIRLATILVCSNIQYKNSLRKISRQRGTNVCYGSYYSTKVGMFEVGAA